MRVSEKSPLVTALSIVFPKCDFARGKANYPFSNSFYYFEYRQCVLWAKRRMWLYLRFT